MENHGLENSGCTQYLFMTVIHTATALSIQGEGGEIVAERSNKDSN